MAGLNLEKLKKLSRQYNYDPEDVKNTFYLTGNFHATEKFIKKVFDMGADLHNLINSKTLDDYDKNRDFFNGISHKERLKAFIKIFLLAGFAVAISIFWRLF